MKRNLVIGLMIVLVGISVSAVRYVQTVLIGKQADGTYLVSSGQIVSPVGRIQLTEYARPKDLAISPDGSEVAVLASGKALIYTRSGDLENSVNLGTAALGICWSADGRSVYVSSGSGVISELGKDEKRWALVRQLPVDMMNATGRETNQQLLGLAASLDGKYLYAAFGMRNAVVKVELSSGKVIDSFATDVAPYRVMLSHDGKRLFVANRGGVAPKTNEAQANSAGTAVAIDRRTDAALRGSVSIINIETGKVQSVPVGRQPSGFALTKDQSKLYVADSDSDTVSVVDPVQGKLTGTLSLRTQDDPEFGRIPTDLALSEDEKRLYVACGGINAVSVVSLETKPEVVGYIPSGWFPIALKSDAQGVIVACSKGIGSRPSNKTTKFGVHDSVGLVQFLKSGDFSNLEALSMTVAKNNKWGVAEKARKDAMALPVPWRIGEPSVFKHVIYIIKENLTYDLAMGDMSEGNGDKSLCIFGENVSPNQHKLAREFVLLDNFYTSGTNSADGHQWTSASLCNGYQEQNYAASQRSYPYDGGDPLAYSPKGYLWTAAAKAKLGVRVYGEFVNHPKVADRKTGKSAGFFDIWEDYTKKTNRFEMTARTDNAALRRYLHPHYIGFPAIVSDQWRADTFLEEFKQFEKQDNLPALCMMLLPNNHTAGTSALFPTPRAMVADNDLALGRIVDAVSHSKYWKDTLILVVEDDSQTGIDHIDGHRTIAMCISAYTKRMQTISEFYNHSSLLKTIELVLGIPPMNRFDYTANAMRDCFSSTPDFRGYNHVLNNIPLDERNPSKKALTGSSLELAELCEKQDWSQYDVADPSVVSQAIWYSQRPNQPFPWSRFHPPSDPDD